MDDLQIKGYSIPGAELEETFTTSGAPGGQHANRTETSVRLRFRVEGSSLPADVRKQITESLGDPVDVIAAESRSQFRNRALARQRMKEALEEALKPKRKRKKTKPTRASKRRRIEDKRRRSETKRLRQPPSPHD